MARCARENWEAMNNDIELRANGDFEVKPIGDIIMDQIPQIIIEDDQYRPYEVPGARRVFWRVDGEWLHKGWLMPQVPHG